MVAGRSEAHTGAADGPVVIQGSWVSGAGWPGWAIRRYVIRQQPPRLICSTTPPAHCCRPSRPSQAVGLSAWSICR